MSGDAVGVQAKGWSIGDDTKAEFSPTPTDPTSQVTTEGKAVTDAVGVGIEARTLSAPEEDAGVTIEVVSLDTFTVTEHGNDSNNKEDTTAADETQMDSNTLYVAESASGMAQIDLSLSGIPSHYAGYRLRWKVEPTSDWSPPSGDFSRGSTYAVWQAPTGSPPATRQFKFTAWCDRDGQGDSPVNGHPLSGGRHELVRLTVDGCPRKRRVCSGAALPAALVRSTPRHSARGPEPLREESHRCLVLGRVGAAVPARLNPLEQLNLHCALGVTAL